MAWHLICATSTHWPPCSGQIVLHDTVHPISFSPSISAPSNLAEVLMCPMRCRLPGTLQAENQLVWESDLWKVTRAFHSRSFMQAKYVGTWCGFCSSWRSIAEAEKSKANYSALPICRVWVSASLWSTDLVQCSGRRLSIVSWNLAIGPINRVSLEPM